MDCIRVSQKESRPVKTARITFSVAYNGELVYTVSQPKNAAGETAVLSGREAVDGVVNIDLDIEIGY